MNAAIDLRNFAFDESLVRVIMDEGNQPWFVAKDVARALGYAETSYMNSLSKLLKAVPDEWKGKKRILTHMCSVPEEWKGMNPIHTLGGEQDMLCLSEQGLYFFVARSDKPAALPFQKWLAGDVLPALRKTGAYSMPGLEGVSEPGLTPAARRLSQSHKVQLLETARQIAKDSDRMPEYLHIFASLCNVVAEGTPAFPPGKIASAPTSVLLFVEECCRQSGTDSWLGIDTLHEAYASWGKLRQEGYVPLKKHKLFEIMLRWVPWAKQYRPRDKRTHKRPYLLKGIALNEDMLFA